MDPPRADILEDRHGREHRELRHLVVLVVTHLQQLLEGAHVALGVRQEGRPDLSHAQPQREPPLLGGGILSQGSNLSKDVGIVRRRCELNLWSKKCSLWDGLGRSTILGYGPRERLNRDDMNSATATKKLHKSEG